MFRVKPSIQIKPFSVVVTQRVLVQHRSFSFLVKPTSTQTNQFKVFSASKSKLLSPFLESTSDQFKFFPETSTNVLTSMLQNPHSLELPSILPHFKIESGIGLMKFHIDNLQSFTIHSWNQAHKKNNYVTVSFENEQRK